MLKLEREGNFSFSTKGDYMHEIKIEKLNEHFYRFVDASFTACYLVIGKEKAALLDTGIGMKGFRSIVDSITNLPLTVLLSHGHADHIGGMHEFEDCTVYLNAKDECLLEDHVNLAERLKYACHFTNDVQLDELQEPWNMRYTPLENNQCFDLGGITVEMVAVPGHTQGMMCPLIKEDRTIIFGDACGVAVMLLNEHSSSVSEYLESLKYLQTYEDQYDTVYRNHGTFTNDKDLLENVMECCQNVLAGTDDHVERDMNGILGYMAKAFDPSTGKNRDGKDGNLFYVMDKVK